MKQVNIWACEQAQSQMNNTVSFRYDRNKDLVYFLKI